MEPFLFLLLNQRCQRWLIKVALHLFRVVLFEQRKSRYALIMLLD